MSFHCVWALSAAIFISLLAAAGPGERAQSGAQPPPKQEKAVKKDFYGDPLPEGAIARLGTLRLLHQADVQSVAITKDGKIAASLARDGVRVWEAATGRQLLHLYASTEFNSSDAIAIAVSPTDNILAVLDSRKGVAVWNLKTQKQSRLVEIKKDYSATLAFSLDGKLLAVGCRKNSTEGRIRMWETATGVEKPKSLELSAEPQVLAFSPDGSKLAVAAAQAIRVFSLSTSIELYKVDTGATLAPSSLAFSSDSEFLLYAFGTSTEICHAKDGTTAKGGPLTAAGVVFAAAGQKMVVADRKSIAVYNGLRGAKTKTLPFPLSGYKPPCLALDSAGSILVTAEHNRVQVWDLQNGVQLHSFPSHTWPITSLYYSGDGKLLVSHVKNETRVLFWEAESGKLSRVIEQKLTRRFQDSYRNNPDQRDLAAIPAIAYSPNGLRLATANELPVVQLWSAQSGKLRKQFSMPSEPGDLFPRLAAHLAFSGDGKVLVAADSDNAIHAWDTQTRKLLWGDGAPKFNRPRIDYLALSPDGKTLAYSIQDGRYGAQTRRPPHPPTIILRNAATGEAIRELPGVGEDIASLNFSPDGKLLLAGYELGSSSEDQLGCGLILWKVDSGEKLRVLETLKGLSGWWALATSPCFSPDGRLVAAAAYGEKGACLRWWEVDTGKSVGELPGPGSKPVAFSPRGTSVATGESEQSIMIWDMVAALRGDKTQTAVSGNLEKLWPILIGNNASDAYGTMASMTENPRTVAFLAKLLKPVPRPTPDLIKRLIGDLDSSRYQFRDQASKLLAEMGVDVLPAIKATLENPPSLEIKMRLRDVVKVIEQNDKRHRCPANAQELQQLRAVQVLMWIGTFDAQKLLAQLAEGASAARQTQDAREALSVLKPFTK